MFKTNKIKFIATSKANFDEGIWPRPKPAGQVIPEEYKKLERHSNNDMKTGTIKRCMPFLDALSAGYMMFFDMDYIIDPHIHHEPAKKDFTLCPSNKHNNIEYHENKQLPSEWHDKIGVKAGKFINKWLIRTPPGYSCLFMHPLNRMEDKWEIFSGVVDTDTYGEAIHFPFRLKTYEKQFLIKKGEPMVQIIPFKRESWKIWCGFTDPEGQGKDHGKTARMLQSEWIDRYKNRYWHKKSWK